MVQEPRPCDNMCTGENPGSLRLTGWHWVTLLAPLGGSRFIHSFVFTFCWLNDRHAKVGLGGSWIVEPSS
jgi:hypothetical protein